MTYCGPRTLRDDGEDSASSPGALGLTQSGLVFVLIPRSRFVVELQQAALAGIPLISATSYRKTPCSVRKWPTRRPMLSKLSGTRRIVESKRRAKAGIAVHTLRIYSDDLRFVLVELPRCIRRSNVSAPESTRLNSFGREAPKIKESLKPPIYTTAYHCLQCPSHQETVEKCINSLIQLARTDSKPRVRKSGARQSKFPMTVSWLQDQSRLPAQER